MRTSFIAYYLFLCIAAGLLSVGSNAAPVSAQDRAGDNASQQVDNSLEESNAVTIKRLEKEMVELKKILQSNTKKQQRLKTSIDSLQERISIQGFASAGLSQTNRDLDYQGASNDLTTLARGRMGLQFNFMLAAKTEAVIQLEAAAANDDWSLETSWAYVQHTISTRYQISVGRMRAPAFSQSQVLNVGYAYPWVRPPREAYTLPFNDLDGIIWTIRQPIGSNGWSAQTRFLYGTNEYGDEAKGLTNNDMRGITVELSNSVWTFRSCYGMEEVILRFKELGFDNQITLGKFFDAALTYENGKLLVINEYTLADTRKTLLGKSAGYFTTVGYRFGQWLPYFTVAQVKTLDDDERLTYTDAEALTAALQGDISLYKANSIANVVNKRQTSYSLGLRYDLQSQTAIKLQIDYGTAFNGTNGFISAPKDALGRLGVHDYDSVTLVNLVIDTVF